jgi:hypothetical protein
VGCSFGFFLCLAAEDGVGCERAVSADELGGRRERESDAAAQKERGGSGLKQDSVAGQTQEKDFKPEQ